MSSHSDETPDRTRPLLGWRATLLIVFFMLLLVVAALGSLGWLVTLNPGMEQAETVELAAMIPTSVYVYSLLGALTFAFTFLIKKFHAAPTDHVAIALRIPAALALAAGMFLLLGFVIDTSSLSGAKLASTVAAASFITGLYVALVLHIFRSIGERLYGATTIVELPPVNVFGPGGLFAMREEVDRAERQPVGTAADTGSILSTRGKFLLLYLVLIVVVVAVTTGWRFGGPFVLPDTVLTPAIEFQPQTSTEAAFDFVTVPFNVYLFSLLGALSFVFTYLYKLYGEAGRVSALQSSQVVKLFARLPAAWGLAAGVYLLLDSGLLVLIKDATIVEGTVIGTVFLTGLFIHLALSRLERLGYQLARLGKLEFVRVSTSHASVSNVTEGDAPPHPDEKRAEGEYIVFRNGGGGPLDLEGWTLVVQYTQLGDSKTPTVDTDPYVFEAATLEPGESMVLYSGTGESGDDYAFYWNRDDQWARPGYANDLLVVDRAGRSMVSKSIVMPEGQGWRSTSTIGVEAS